MNYSSTNKAEHTTFVAVSPPNSNHAAKLAQIAMMVQSKQTPKGKEKRVGALTSNVAPRAQIQAVAYDEVPQSYRTQQPSYQQASNTGYYEDGVEEIIPQNRSPVRVSVLPPPTRLPARTHFTPTGPPQVFRQATEQTTSYEVRGSNGKLQVSAPAGSNEAQLFDEVARLNSESAQTHRDDNRVARHHHGSKHKQKRGWFGL